VQNKTEGKTGKLQKYMVTVNDFVKSKVCCDETEDGCSLRFKDKKTKRLRKQDRRNHLRKQSEEADSRNQGKKAILEANVAEDREIKRLEGSLGDDDMDIAKKKFRKLEDSESEMSGKEEEEQGQDSEEEGSELDSDGDLDTDAEEGKYVEEDEIDEDEEGMDESGGAAGKYVPPHLRDTSDDKRKAELERLKRQVKGLVNQPSVSGGELQSTNHRKCDVNKKQMGHLLPCRRLFMDLVAVGTNFLERVVRKFDGMYKTPVAMVAHLYNFQVVHDMVLFMLKNVGFALRKDDALALKELISGAQRKASGVGTKFQDENRVRSFTNNDMRKIPVHDPEPVERLQKLQRTLIHQSSGANDVKLRVYLENLLAAEQVGRWWIVGQTDIRRNIFCVIMTICDTTLFSVYRMGLKDQQEREIVHLLMDCCLQEKRFNAFYAVLGDKFYEHDRQFQVREQGPFFLLSRSHETSLARVLWLSCKTAPLRLDHVKSLVSMSVIVLCLVRILGIPKLGMLWEGLKLFISHFLLKNAQSQGTAEQTGLLSERAEVATKAMEAKETKLKL
uniref:Nucleolar protein with MIF4G domain 1 n=1 Tax=Salmo trutta TaxID=8032 RepID=A0A673Y767_SALTR